MKSRLYTKFMQQLWHAITFEETLSELKVDPVNGLSNDAAQMRLSQFGANSLPQPKSKSLLKFFLDQFKSPLIYLLLAAAIISFIVNEPKDALVIITVVLLNSFVGAIQEGRAEQSLASLRKLAKLSARVLRQGQELSIESSMLVPGDIITLYAGDAVPADARLITTNAFAVSEASLTGESVPIFKTNQPVADDSILADRHCMIYAGTHVTAGRSTSVVVATGLNNEIGQIAKMASNVEESKAQLELRIQEFGKKIAWSSVALFLLILSIGLLHGIPFTSIFMVAVSQMVSLVPEGLPVAMTIALAVGVLRLSRRKTIVRKLSAVEALGSTTVICTDKTGTLTKNEMTVTNICLFPANHKVEVTGVGYRPEGEFYLSQHGQSVALTFLESSTWDEFFKAITLCNDSVLLPPDDSRSDWRIIGDPTEAALIAVVEKAGRDPGVIRKNHSRIAEIPFDSDHKMMATQYLVDGKVITYLKGAPEAIFNLCSTQDSVNLEIARTEAKLMSDRALRVLAVAKAEGISLETSIGFQSFIGQLQLIALVGQFDPPRPEVKDAVLQCRAAGVRPVMITGDHVGTAIAIAKDLGIYKEGDHSLDGTELDRLDDLSLQKQIKNTSVFARVHPTQKLKIVKALQNQSEVVAMTGDGVNDAPALMQSNIGVAMGKSGTEVAKEASKIIITDDNFSTIVEAIAGGRLVYQNIKKLILFLFVTSVDEVVILLLALLFGYPPPLAAVQILWINLVSEGALTVNLIMEPAEGNEMQRPPIQPNEPLLDKALLKRIPLMLFSSVLATFGWFVWRTKLGIAPEVVQSETFTILVVCQWFNVLNCRSETQSVFSMRLYKNPWLLGGLIFGNLMHGLVIFWPPLSHFFHTTPFGIKEFIMIGAVASLVLWVEEARKFLAKKT